MNMRRGIRWVSGWTAALGLGFAGALAGCDDDKDFNHRPAAGLGSLIVDNKGLHDVRVYVDGRLAGTVQDDHWHAFDLTPGEHRVALDERNGDRFEVVEVDVLEGRRMVVEVTVAGYNYDVWTYLD